MIRLIKKICQEMRNLKIVQHSPIHTVIPCNCIFWGFVYYLEDFIRFGVVYWGSLT